MDSSVIIAPIVTTRVISLVSVTRETTALKMSGPWREFETYGFQQELTSSPNGVPVGSLPFTLNVWWSLGRRHFLSLLFPLVINYPIPLKRIWGQRFSKRRRVKKNPSQKSTRGIHFRAEIPIVYWVQNVGGELGLVRGSPGGRHERAHLAIRTKPYPRGPVLLLLLLFFPEPIVFVSSSDRGKPCPRGRHAF